MVDAQETTRQPARVARGKVRAVRFALGWVIVVCLLFLASFPLLRRAAPAAFPWRSFAIIVGYVAAALFGIVMIPRNPRDVAAVLAAAATVNALSALNIFRRLSSGRPWPGPAATGGTLAALTLLSALVFALIMAWRAHLELRDHAV